MGNFVYLKYTKSQKSVYLKYTKLHCRSLQADKHYSYGTVFTGCSSPWAMFASMPVSGAVLIDGGAPSEST